MDCAYLDDTDLKILDELKKNARTPFTDIGACVGLTGPAVRDRIRRMEDDGVITGYTALVSSTALGKSLRAIISVKPTPSAGADVDRSLSRQIAALPGVLRYITVTGEIEGLIEVAMRSMKDFDELSLRINRMGYATTTHFILDDSNDWHSG